MDRDRFQLPLLFRVQVRDRRLTMGPILSPSSTKAHKINFNHRMHENPLDYYYCSFAMAFKFSSIHFSLPKPHKTNQINPSISLFASPIFSFLYLPNNDAAAGRKLIRRQLCAVSMDKTQYSIKETEDVSSPSSSSNKSVLVIGGTGGVGQLIVASLLSRNIRLHLLLRDPTKAEYLFGMQDEDKLRIWKGDTRNPKDIDPAMFEGVTHVICCTGTTAFPSKRWGGDNTPEKVDWEGIRNLVSALPRTLKRFVLVSSVGVTKFDELPWSIMNLFGVLKYKKMGEDFVRNSGLPYTIIRPGRLTDGPYTSYDLNTLLQATAGERRAVVIGQGDKLVGEVSRLVVAEACIQALDIEFTEGQIYEINSVEGEGPGSDIEKWKKLFKAAAAN